VQQRRLRNARHWLELLLLLLLLLWDCKPWLH
jgi:hypothetical protein